MGTASGTAGSRIGVPISLNDGGGVAGFQVDVSYDPSLMTVAGARLGRATSTLAGWAIDRQVMSSGLVRVLGFSNPPNPLRPGFAEIALVDFDIALSRTASDIPFRLQRCVLGDATGLSIPCLPCLEPGIDEAVPRFVISLVGDALGFVPARPAVEQGDRVLWKNTGTTAFHTTTSGSGCSPDGRWDGPLSPGSRFGRRFPEAPGSLPYYSTPDCLLGMVGEVRVTEQIVVMVSEASGITQLTWQGGSGLYQVWRSDNPAFVGVGTETSSPDGGDSGISFTDLADLPAGGAFFYLVTNKN